MDNNDPNLELLQVLDEIERALGGVFYVKSDSLADKTLPDGEPVKLRDGVLEALEELRDDNIKQQASGGSYGKVYDLRPLLRRNKFSVIEGGKLKRPTQERIEEIITNPDYPKKLITLSKNTVFMFELPPNEEGETEEIVLKQGDEDLLRYEHSILSLLAKLDLEGIAVPTPIGMYTLSQKPTLAVKYNAGKHLGSEHDLGEIVDKYLALTRKITESVYGDKIRTWDYLSLTEKLSSLPYQGRIQENLHPTLNELNIQERTFVHGDLHRYQFRIQENGKIVIVDWASASWGVPHIDIAAIVEGYPGTTPKKIEDFIGAVKQLRSHNHFSDEHELRLLYESSIYVGLRYLLAYGESPTKQNLQQFYVGNILNSTQKLVQLSSTRTEKQRLKQLENDFQELSSRL